METNVMRTPYVELTDLKVRSVSSVRRATQEMYAQFNRWCDDNHYPRGLRVHSILVNKVVYYAEKEIQKTNDKFRVDTGWYLYGPCFEEGRKFEQNERPISILPVSEDVSDQMEKVCKELVPRFADEMKASGRGGVLRNFLGYVYSHKCDHAELQAYYEAKHGLQCQLWAFGGALQFNPAEQAEAVTDAVTQFDRALLGDYPKAVGLKESTVENLLEFTPLFEEYAQMVAEGTDSLPFFEVLDRAAGFMLRSLAHRNYAYTFESFNPNYARMMKATQEKQFQKHLGLAEIENQRLYDAYGQTLRAAK